MDENVWQTATDSSPLTHLDSVKYNSMDSTSPADEAEEDGAQQVRHADVCAHFAFEHKNTLSKRKP